MKIRFTLAALVMLVIGMVLWSDKAYCDVSQRLSISGDVSYDTKLVLRGVQFNPDGSIHPNVTVSHPGGLSFNWWACVDTTDIYSAKNKITENDFTLNYHIGGSKIAHDVGFIHYQFPNTVFKRTTEIYFSTSWKTDYSPWLNVLYDVDRDRGFYIRGGASHPVSLGDDGSPLVLKAIIGFGSPVYNKAHFGGTSDVNKFTWNEILLGASKTFELNRHTSFTPSLYLTALIDNDLRDASANPDNVFLNLMFSFK